MIPYLPIFPGNVFGFDENHHIFPEKLFNVVLGSFSENETR